MQFLPAVNNFSRHDCRHRRAIEFAVIDGSIARFAGGGGGAKRPGVIGGKKCEVGQTSRRRHPISPRILINFVHLFGLLHGNTAAGANGGKED